MPFLKEISRNDDVIQGFKAIQINRFTLLIGDFVTHLIWEVNESLRLYCGILTMNPLSGFHLHFILQSSTWHCTVMARAIPWTLQFIVRHSTVKTLVRGTAHIVYYTPYIILIVRDLRPVYLNIASLICDQQYSRTSLAG